jgi:hypothetical protein
MGAISFDKPSEGIVTDTVPPGSVPNPALTLYDSGDGAALICFSDKSNAIFAYNADVPATSSVGEATIFAVSRDTPTGYFDCYGDNNTIMVRNESTRPDYAGINSYSASGIGVVGISNGDKEGVVGICNGSGAGIRGRSYGGGLAGWFVGNVQVDGDILISGADCAEEFEVSSTDAVESGTVMVLNQSGNVEQSYQAYDKKVAGVVSGAGTYKSAIILDKKEKVQNIYRLPIALMGKTYCKVDATHCPIETGDLLTTSPTHGHAMRATDPSQAFGAVIGKALRPLKEGKGLIPILVVLQ